MRAPWPTVTLFMTLMLASLTQATDPKIREIESSQGWVRLSILPIGEVPPESGSADTNAAVTPSRIADIEDFTSLTEMDREGEALLEVHLLDKGSGEELRFPLKYSQLRAYLNLRPIQYQGGTAQDRTVAMIRDLAGDFRIRMKDPVEGKAKP